MIWYVDGKGVSLSTAYQQRTWASSSSTYSIFLTTIMNMLEFLLLCYISVCPLIYLRHTIHCGGCQLLLYYTQLNYLHKHNIYASIVIIIIVILLVVVYILVSLSVKFIIIHTICSNYNWNNNNKIVVIYK